MMERCRSGNLIEECKHPAFRYSMKQDSVSLKYTPLTKHEKDTLKLNFQTNSCSDLIGSEKQLMFSKTGIP